jgi:hypothetical protein
MTIGMDRAATSARTLVVLAATVGVNGYLGRAVGSVGCFGLGVRQPPRATCSSCYYRRPVGAEHRSHAARCYAYSSSDAAAVGHLR